jgi:threonine/homoserine/homoserine lactone efflux protein
MKQRCLTAVVALLLVGPSVIAYSPDSSKPSFRGATQSVVVSESSMMFTLGIAFLGLAKLQRSRTVRVC